MTEAKTTHHKDPVECLKLLKENVDKYVTICSEEYISLKDKYEKLVISSSKTSEECKTLAASITEINKTNEKLRNELTTTNQRYEGLQKQLMASNKQNEEFQKQLTNLKRRNETLQKELTDSGLSLNEALNQNAQLELSLNQTKSEVKDVKVELKQVTDEKSKIELKLKREQNKNSKLMEQLDTFKKVSANLSSLCVSVNDRSDDEDNLSSSSYEGGNLPSPASADNIIRTRANALVSPKKNERVSSGSPVSPKANPSENQSNKLAFVLVDDKEKSSNQTSTAVSSVRDNRITRRSSVSPISVASSVSPPVNVEKDDRSSPLTINVPVTPNQTNIVGLPKKDNRDTVRGQLSFSTLPATPNNASKAIAISADGVYGGNRPFSPTVNSLQNKPTQLRGILSPRSDYHSRSPISSNLVPSEASTSTKEINRLPITSPANQQVPEAEKIVAVPPKQDNIPSIVVTSGLDNQSKVNPVPTGNQTITSTLPASDSRNLRRSSLSPIGPTSKNQSTAKPISVDANTPSKHLKSPYPSPGSPSFLFSPKTPSKGTKEQDVHLSRSSLLISRAQETQREADNNQKDDKIIGSNSSPNTEKKTSQIAAEKSQNLSIVIEEEASSSSNIIRDSANEALRPEDTIPLLYPDLRNISRRSLTNSEWEGSKILSILDENCDESSHSSTMSDKSSRCESQYGSNIHKFPIVTLSRVEVPKEQITPPENRKNRNNSDVAGPSKRRKSSSEPVLTKRRAIMDLTSDASSTTRSRVSRLVKQKVYTGFV